MRLKPPGRDCYPHKNRKRNQSSSSLCSRTEGETVICMPGKQLLLGKVSADTLILDFPASRLWEINSCCLSHRVCGIFFMAAWASQDTAPGSYLTQRKGKVLTIRSIRHAWPTPSPLSPCFGSSTLFCTHSAAVTLISQLFIENAKHVPTPGPLHVLCPLPRKPSPGIPSCLTSSFPSRCLLHHWGLPWQNDGNYQQPPSASFSFLLYLLLLGAWGHLTVHVFLFASLVLSDCARCSLQHTASLAVAHWLSGPTVCIWDLNSPTRERTCIPCIGRQIFFLFSRGKIPIYYAKKIRPTRIDTNEMTGNGKNKMEIENVVNCALSVQINDSEGLNTISNLYFKKDF